MTRVLLIIMSCAVLTACGGGSSNNASGNNQGGGTPLDNTGLNPTAIVLDTPPVNGQLPASLQPPA